MTEPATRPATIQRWQKMKNTNTGMSAMVVTVMNNGQFVVKVLIALNTCSTMVCLLVDEMYTLGVMKSFHVPMVWNTMTVVRIGRISGSTIVQKMRNGPAPSIRAASMISYGRPRMYCTIKK